VTACLNQQLLSLQQNKHSSLNTPLLFPSLWKLLCCGLILGLSPRRTPPQPLGRILSVPPDLRIGGSLSKQLHLFVRLVITHISQDVCLGRWAYLVDFICWWHCYFPTICSVTNNVIWLGYLDAKYYPPRLSASMPIS
jgi:hypothetical protein